MSNITLGVIDIKLNNVHTKGRIMTNKITTLEESLAEYTDWANELLEDDNRVTTSAPLTDPWTPELRASESRRKKQDILKQFAQLGNTRTEFIWASQHDVFMTKEQILDYLDQTVEDPKLTALEYMHNNGYTTDGLLKGMLKSIASTGLSKSDIFGIFKSAKRGQTTSGPGTISRAAKGLLRSMVSEDDGEDNGPYMWFKDNPRGKGRPLNMTKDRAVKFVKGQEIMQQQVSDWGALVDNTGKIVFRYDPRGQLPERFKGEQDDTSQVPDDVIHWDAIEPGSDEMTRAMGQDRGTNLHSYFNKDNEQDWRDWSDEKAGIKKPEETDEGLDSYRHVKPNPFKKPDNMKDRQFPDPAPPYIENGKVIGVKGPNGEKRMMSKSQVVGADGMIYHWQDPRQHNQSTNESGNSQSDAKKAYNFIRDNWMDNIELRKYAGTTKNPKAFYQAVHDYRMKDSEDRIVSALARAFDSVYTSNDSPRLSRETANESESSITNRLKLLAGILK